SGPECGAAGGRERGQGARARLMRPVSRPPKGAVRVSGLDGEVLVRFAKCCQPLPGERIAGFITRGRGVTVHAGDCPKVLETDPQRRVDVEWQDAKGIARAVRIEGTG